MTFMSFRNQTKRKVTGQRKKRSRKRKKKKVIEQEEQHSKQKEKLDGQSKNNRSKNLFSKNSA